MRWAFFGILRITYWSFRLLIFVVFLGSAARLYEKTGNGIAAFISLALVIGIYMASLRWLRIKLGFMFKKSQTGERADG